jgi:hypothetical protein
MSEWVDVVAENALAVGEHVVVDVGGKLIPACIFDFYPSFLNFYR